MTESQYQDARRETLAAAERLRELRARLDRARDAVADLGIDSPARTRIELAARIKNYEAGIRDAERTYAAAQAEEARCRRELAAIKDRNEFTGGQMLLGGL